MARRAAMPEVPQKQLSLGAQPSRSGIWQLKGLQHEHATIHDMKLKQSHLLSCTHKLLAKSFVVSGTHEN